ncbi:novel immune-type receptor 14b [Triplophysa dalaica]|uniref:novel immune-type receptor 14b n=1 Tax=Triplophysa dalaica TaxID=1582913 RepID=UPI0024DFCEBA|nr:novel immune-type receptor 14b [Triplophysa dalaica]
MITLVFIIVPSIVLFSGSVHPGDYQANQVRTVELGDTVSLECSVKHNTILWFKQIARHQPRIISVFQQKGETNFYYEFKDGRFQRSHFNLTISHINQSDAAVYHCGSKAHYVAFGRGAQLIIKGQKDSSTISKSHYLNDSMERQQECYENNTKQVNTEEHHGPVVLGLAVALGLCGILIFIILCLIFKRGMCLQCLTGVAVQDERVRGLAGTRDADDDILTYAALRFSRKKKNLEKRENNPSKV